MSRAALKIYCGHQDYLSHARSAADYASILRTLCTVVQDPAEADVALLHHEPHHYVTLLEETPQLQGKFLIGYCVWEAETLPRAYLPGISAMDELWTASAFCHEIFARYHACVTWIPHVAELQTAATPADRAALSALLDTSPAYYNYVAFTKGNDLRKNIPALRQAFAYVSRRLPTARLIIKTAQIAAGEPAPPVATEEGRVVILNGLLSAGEMAALYELADACVSPHHGEGWGLTLSDAMLHGVPVVATAYSGNMDFMTRYNSLWVGYTAEKIHRKDVYALFDPSMRWAYPHRESLERQMIEVYRMSQDGSLKAMTAQARRDIALYDRAHLTRHLQQHVERLAQDLRTGRLLRRGQRPAGQLKMGRRI